MTTHLSTINGRPRLTSSYQLCVDGKIHDCSNLSQSSLSLTSKRSQSSLYPKPLAPKHKQQQSQSQKQPLSHHSSHHSSKTSSSYNTTSTASLTKLSSHHSSSYSSTTITCSTSSLTRPSITEEEAFYEHEPTSVKSLPVKPTKPQRVPNMPRGAFKKRRSSCWGGRKARPPPIPWGILSAEKPLQLASQHDGKSFVEVASLNNLEQRQRLPYFDLGPTIEAIQKRQYTFTYCQECQTPLACMYGLKYVWCTCCDHSSPLPYYHRMNDHLPSNEKFEPFGIGLGLTQSKIVRALELIKQQEREQKDLLDNPAMEHRQCLSSAA